MTEEIKGNTKYIKPNEGFQKALCSSGAVDVVFSGGILAGGKRAPLSSHVLTKKGWVTMGDIHLNDKVMTPFDGEANVIGVFPQGVQDVYKLTTSDGRVAECGFEHLWTIRTQKQLYRYNNNGKKWDWITTLTTEELIKKMKKGTKCFLPIPSAIEFGEKGLPIPPYLLGAMIGDGCLTDMGGSGCFKISNSEEDIIDKIYELSESTRLYRQPKTYTKYFYTPNIKIYRDYLKETGLNTYSYNKYIPELYLRSSIEQRRELLYGLMDTDGAIETKGNTASFSYSTTSTRLKDDFVELCRSLGYITKVKVDKRAYKYTSGVAYNINILTDDVIFTSKKHLGRFNSVDLSKRKYGRSNDHVRIISIKKDRREESQCILLDDEKHLYVCDDYVTTHNSFGLLLAAAQPLMTDPDFRCMVTRKSLGSLKSGGGMVDTISEIFGDYAHIKIADNPKATFPNGGTCEFTYIDDSNIDKTRERLKGLQIDLFLADEITEMPWELFCYIQTRNRGRSKTFTGKFFATLNPKKSHWTRQWLDWYIGIDGFIIPERNGCVRYFYINGSSVKDVVWGDSKEEVYYKCKVDIDRKLAKVGGNFDYRNMIKSFVFYQGKLSENTPLLANNPDYVGSVAASGGKMAEALLEGNYNKDPEEEENIPIPTEFARQVPMNDPQTNNDKWITCDLADTGTDNLVALCWNGFNIEDVMILCQSTPRMNAERLLMFAEKHHIANSHIIYDAIRGTYINDYIEEAVQFVSYRSPMGLYGRQAKRLKDECYLRLAYMINKGLISMDESVANKVYIHQNMSQQISIATEFIEECNVVRFVEVGYGQKRLLSKKEMNAMLGRGRSMDLLDPCAMRMLPCLNLEYGSELESGLQNQISEDFENESYNDSPYDDSCWA